MAKSILPSELLFGIPLILIFVLGSCEEGKPVTAQEDNYTEEVPSAAAVAEWNAQKYSMFIHFGLYSLPAGVWEGKKVKKGYSEQIRAHGNISREDFRALARDFNPGRWNADSVALLAKNAGMKSIVITAKHHDGFAMYHSKYSDFNIVDATPYKKDILKELALACKKHGLKFGVYYSLIDWDFPGALPISDHNSDSIPPAHHQLNLRQVEELMTGYGPVSEIWFDMGKLSPEQSRDLVAMVRKYQPDCLVSGRIWNDQGDFAVMGDNASPDFRMGTLWQTPASLFDETWGYRSWQERGGTREKALEKLRGLVNTVSNGGNYLLNIGPKGDGSIVEFEKEVLLAIGQWLKIHGEAIYGTHPAPLPEQDWGVLTQKPGQLFLFLQDGHPDGPVIIRGLRSKIRAARLLTDPSVAVQVDDSAADPALAFESAGIGHLPAVIAVDYEGKLQYLPPGVLTAPEKGELVLSPATAIKYHSYSGADYYSTRPTVIRMEWHVQGLGEQVRNLRFQYIPTEYPMALQLGVNGEIFTIRMEAGAGNPSAETSDLEVLNLPFLPAVVNRVTLRLTDTANLHADMGMEDCRMVLY